MVNFSRNRSVTISSMQLITILEMNKSSKDKTDGYWRHWKNLYKRDFPNAPCPDPVIPETLASSEDKNQCYADHYEALYRHQEIIAYTTKVDSIIDWLDNRYMGQLISLEDSSLFQKLFDKSRYPTEYEMKQIRATYAEILVNHANITQSTTLGFPPPMVAALSAKNLDVMRELIVFGADVTEPDELDIAPVFHELYSISPDHTIIFFLLEEIYKKNAILKEYNAGTVLQQFTRKGDIELISAIKDKYPQIDFSSYTTMLQTAIFMNNAAMVVYLLNELKMDANMFARNGMPLLFWHIALRDPEHKDGYKAFGEYNPKNTSILESLLDAGANVDLAYSDKIITPLMLAASSDDLPAVTLLLERGANANIVNNVNLTASSYAEAGSRMFDLLVNAENIQTQSEEPKAKKCKLK